MCLGIYTKISQGLFDILICLKKSPFEDKPSPVCIANSRTKCPKGKQTSSLYLDSYPTPSLPPKLLLSTLWHFAKKKKKVFFLCCSYTPPPFLTPLPPSTALCERERGRGISLRKWRALERLESLVECSGVSGCTSGFLFLQADELIMEKWAWPQ